MRAYQQNLEKLEASGTQVLGVSMDSTFANKAWADQIGVTFPLLSDWGGEVTRQFGVFDPRYKAARRVTFLIDENGKIVHMQTDKEAIDPSQTVNACQRSKLNR